MENDLYFRVPGRKYFFLHKQTICQEELKELKTSFKVVENPIGDPDRRIITHYQYKMESGKTPTRLFETKKDLLDNLERHGTN